MPDFTNIRDLVNYIQKQAVESIQKTNSESSQIMIDTGERHVQSDVYDKYAPNPNGYKRTGQLKEDWQIESTLDGIAMTNTRADEETNKYIPSVIETGRGYDYLFPFYNVPRPFIYNTFLELSRGIELRNAVKNDLKSSGLNIE